MGVTGWVVGLGARGDSGSAGWGCVVQFVSVGVGFLTAVVVES